MANTVIAIPLRSHHQTLEPDRLGCENRLIGRGRSLSMTLFCMSVLGTLEFAGGEAGYLAHGAASCRRPCVESVIRWAKQAVPWSG
jgi:hypothetical protein